MTADAVWRLRGRTQLVAGDAALLLRLGDRRARLAPFGPAAERFVHLLSEGGTEQELGRRFEAAEGDGAWAAVDGWFARLRDGGFLERLDLDHALDAADVARFDRLLHFFSEFEAEGLDRYRRLEQLRGRTVGVVGTGGLGSWILYGLVCCGVGRLRLLDGDVVEASNLNRSILFTEDDIGVPKVEAARRTLLRFAPRTEVSVRQGVVGAAADLAGFVDGVDLVVGAADQPTWLIREWIARACHEAGVPVVHPSGLRVGPFTIPGRTSCTMCDWAAMTEANPAYPRIVEAQRRLPRGNSGGLAPWASVTASVAVMEAFRFLSGQSDPVTLNAVWEMRGDYTATVRPVPRHPACTVCGAGGPA